MVRSQITIYKHDQQPGPIFVAAVTYKEDISIIRFEGDGPATLHQVTGDQARLGLERWETW